jgi:hypothetical protein
MHFLHNNAFGYAYYYFNGDIGNRRALLAGWARL